MVPGSPRSELFTEPCAGPSRVVELPAGSQPDYATAVDKGNISEEGNSTIRSTVNRYVKDDPGAAAPNIGVYIKDNMSVSSFGGSTNLKRARDERGSASNSDGEGPSHRSHKVLRSRIVISSDSDELPEGPIVLSDSSEDAAKKVGNRKLRAKRIRNTNLDLSTDLANLVFTDWPGRLICEELVTRDVDDLAGVANAWLSDME